MADRILGPFKALVREFLSPDTSDVTPAWSYFVPWEFSVTSATDTTFTGRATSSRCPVPDLVSVPIMPGLAGALITPAVGSAVAVVFVNGDPTRPRMVSWDQAFAQHVALQTAASAQALTALTVDVGPAGVQVYDAANIPPAAYVAMAQPVQTFANASITLSTASGAAFTALAAFATDVGTQVPATSATATAAATACTAAAAACGAFSAAVGALVGFFPTGFSATKLKTQ